MHCTSLAACQAKGVLMSLTRPVCFSPPLPQVGQIMSEFPLDPQLAKMLVASPNFRCSNSGHNSTCNASSYLQQQTADTASSYHCSSQHAALSYIALLSAVLHCIAAQLYALGPVFGASTLS